MTATSITLSLACTLARATNEALPPSGPLGLAGRVASQMSSGSVPEAAAENGLRTASALTQQMRLRDAIYLYDRTIYDGYERFVIAQGCEVLQLVLDVESGKVPIAYVEGSTPAEVEQSLTIYRDDIRAEARMFSYALATSGYLKGFSFSGRVKDRGLQQIGKITAFFYCFSRETTAKLTYHDEWKGSPLNDYVVPSTTP